MDLTNAVLLVAVVFGAVELTVTAFPFLDLPTSKRWKVLVVIGEAQGTVFLVRYSVWANEQVIGNKTLDLLNIPSLVIVGIALAVLASTGKQLLKAVTNVGQNQVKYPVAAGPLGAKALENAEAAGKVLTSSTPIAR